jgi:hypothetical protein
MRPIASALQVQELALDECFEMRTFFVVERGIMSFNGRPEIDPSDRALSSLARFEQTREEGRPAGRSPSKVSSARQMR